MQKVFCRFKESKWISLVFKLLLTLLAFWYVLHNIDTEHLLELINKQDQSLIFAAAFFMTLQIALGGVRWRMLVVAINDNQSAAISWLKAQKFYYISVFFNCCLPGTIGGDVVRVWLARSEHILLTHAINSVIIDRLLGLVALGIIMLATLPLLAEITGFVLWPFWILAAIAFALLLYMNRRSDALFSRFLHWRAVDWLKNFMEALRKLAAHQWTSLGALLVTILTHISYFICCFVLAQSLRIDISLLQCTVLLPPIMLAAILPVSIGGWGVREAGMVWLFGMIGVPKAAALALSVQLGILNIILSLPAALLWLTHRKYIHKKAHL